jgi:hypothetical protein
MTHLLFDWAATAGELEEGEIHLDRPGLRRELPAYPMLLF